MAIDGLPPASILAQGLEYMFDSKWAASSREKYNSQMNALVSPTWE